MLGTSVREVLGSGRVEGVRSGRARGRSELRAPLVVGADGRSSTIAKATGAKTRVRPLNRSAAWCYYEGIEMKARPEIAGQIWLLEPRLGYAMRTDSGLTAMVVWVLAEEDRMLFDQTDSFILDFMSKLPAGPDVSNARVVGKPRWMRKWSNIRRVPTGPGYALVGDATVSVDPVWGTGCSFAIQSGGLFAETVGPALANGGDVEAGLRRYRRAHRHMCGPPLLADGGLLHRATAECDRAAALFGQRPRPGVDRELPHLCQPHVGLLAVLVAGCARPRRVGQPPPHVEGQPRAG